MSTLIPILDSEDAITKLEDAGFKYCGASTKELNDISNECSQSREVGIFFKSDKKAAFMKFGILEVYNPDFTRDIRDALETREAQEG